MSSRGQEPSVVWLRHCRLELALHPLVRRDGPSLLWLHELGGESPTRAPRGALEWPGAVWALDSSGHGQSQHARAGGYSPEVLMADVDAALAEIGPATVVGEGLGAFLALLIAGSRPDQVRGVVLCDGKGLAGGGPEPKPIAELWLPTDVLSRGGGGTDPYALVELSRDIRPPGYARIFARQAQHLSGMDTPIRVAARPPHPPWLEGILDGPGVEISELSDALDRYSRQQ